MRLFLLFALAACVDTSEEEPTTSDLVGGTEFGDEGPVSCLPIVEGEEIEDSSNPMGDFLQSADDLLLAVPGEFSSGSSALQLSLDNVAVLFSEYQSVESTDDGTITVTDVCEDVITAFGSFTLEDSLLTVPLTSTDFNFMSGGEATFRATARVAWNPLVNTTEDDPTEPTTVELTDWVIDSSIYPSFSFADYQEVLFVLSAEQVEDGWQVSSHWEAWGSDEGIEEVGPSWSFLQ